jgi:hypothetical protein
MKKLKITLVNSVLFRVLKLEFRVTNWEPLLVRAGSISALAIRWSQMPSVRGVVRRGSDVEIVAHRQPLVPGIVPVRF